MASFAGSDDTAERGLGCGLSSTQLDSKSEEPPTGGSTTAADCDEEKEYSEFLKRECLGFEDHLKTPLGWPRLAAMPTYFSNSDMLRTFSAVGMRLIQARGARLAFLHKELGKFDNEENIHLTALTEYQMRLPGQSVAKGSLDIFLEVAEQEYDAYVDLVKRYKEMLQLHPIPRKQYNDMISFIFNSESEPMLKGDSLLWINSPDEAVCVSAPLSDFMVWLIHTKPVKWLVKLFSKARPGPRRDMIPRAHLEMAHKALIALGALAVLMPIGIMFLCDLTKVQSFGVVIGFSILFGLSVTLTQKTDSHSAWIVVCAFSAILVTVMVQLGTVSPQK